MELVYEGRREPFANFKDLQNVIRDKWHDVDDQTVEKSYIYKLYSDSAEVSGHFGTGAEVSYGHFGTRTHWDTSALRQPFTQLFSIHAFVKKDGELMQTPLASLSSSCRVVVVRTTSACSVRLSPRFHSDHAYKPLCPTLKRLCGQP